MLTFASSIRKDRQSAILPHNFQNITTMLANQDVINAFANGKIAKNRNMHSTGNKLFSYTTCIAQRFEDGTIVVNSTKYSVSTSKVQTYTRYTLKTYKEVTNVPIYTYDLGRFVN